MSIANRAFKRRSGFLTRSQAVTMRKLFLIRHGITEQNKQRRYCGVNDVCLSAQGLRQVELTAKVLSGESITSIYTSPLKRCLQTSNAISKVNGISPQPINGLSEIDFGLWDGLTFDEIQSQYPEQSNNWFNDPAGFTFPQGQSVSGFRDTVLTSLEDILNGQGDSVIVAHGGSLRAIICHVCGLPMSHYHSFELGHAGITTLQQYDDSIVIKHLNDTCHLKQEGAI